MTPGEIRRRTAGGCSHAPFVAGALALPLLGYLVTGDGRIEAATPGWLACVFAVGLAVERERRRAPAGAWIATGPGRAQRQAG